MIVFLDLPSPFVTSTYARWCPLSLLCQTAFLNLPVHMFAMSIDVFSLHLSPLVKISSDSLIEIPRLLLDGSIIFGIIEIYRAIL